MSASPLDVVCGVHGSASAALLALAETGASPITSTSARSASLTPSPVTPEINSGVFFAARFSRSFCFFSSSGVNRVDLVQRDDLDLVGEMSLIGFELGAHRLVGLAGVLAGRVDQMQQHAAALDMAEEAVAEAGAFMRALDQAGNIRQHEFAAVGIHDAELRMQRGEGIVGDLRLGRADHGEEGRLAGIGQADEAGIRDQLQPQPDPALLARLAGIGVARRAVGGGFEMRVAEPAIAAFGEHEFFAERR